MIRYDPDLQEILAFGTDCELALSIAFESAFPFAVHLLCDMHMEDTIISKLKDLGIRGLEAKQYMADILGDNPTHRRQVWFPVRASIFATACCA